VSEFLVVRLSREADQASWLVLSEQGHRLSHTSSGPLSAAAAESRDRKVVLLVPGIEAVSTRVTLPVKRTARIQQMLPFTLEDAVAEDVEELHFAAGPRAPDGSIAVAIVSRRSVADWLARCADAGLRVDTAFVDVQGVPETPGSLTLMLEGSTIYGRLPDREPFVLEDLTLAALVEILAAPP
jgi:general secretion pathway protein L